jgi:hypothetical protein
VRTKETTKGKKGKGKAAQVMHENELMETTLSFSFPNFETCKHCVDVIKFIGLPMFHDMMLWEQQHLAAKWLCRLTNQRNVTRDVFVKVCESLTFLVFVF